MPRTRRTQQIHAMVEPSLSRKITDEAEKMETSVSSFVRMVLNRYFKDKEADENRDKTTVGSGG